MRIAVDAMGGDHAPKEIVAGAVQSLSSLDNGDVIVLVGNSELIEQELTELGISEQQKSKLEIVHASQVVEMSDNPVDAMKNKTDSSIARMVDLAAKKQVDAMISAGNTGACVAACQMKLGRLKGVIRPGIAVVIPTFNKAVVLCDVGANPAPKPHHMHQYALMAAIYAEVLFKLDGPARVALLNIGEEDAKGNPLVKQARDLIKADERINFVGFVEGRYILADQTDVVICDGFVGNVVLKLIEGLASAIAKMLAKEVERIDPKLVKPFVPALENLWRKHDYTEHGGAPLLGVDGLFIVCHGSSNRTAIKNAVAMAHKLRANNINERIVEKLNIQNETVSSNDSEREGIT